MTTNMTEKLDILENIRVIMQQIFDNKEHQIQIDDLLSKRHEIPRGTFYELMINPNRFETLNEIEKIVVVNTIFEVTKNENIDPKKFFSDKEINKAKKFKYENESELQLPITLEGVLRTTHEDYLTVLSYQTIAKLWNSGILSYNFQTQRLSKRKINAKGKIIEKADINNKSVKNIARLMLEGKYRPSTILFNVLVDGKSSIEYDDGNLTINEGSTVNLIDGMHRVQAILLVLEQEPDFEGYMNVDIKHYPLEVAQQLLAITNTVNRFDKTLIKHYMGESIGAQITKALMNIPELKNRISIKTSLDKKMNYLTNFAILSEAIETIFDPKDTKERYDYTEVLSKFFGYLISAYENEFTKNKNEVAKASWINHHNTFVGYVVIAKALFDKYGKDFPVDEIVRIVNSIDFAKETSEYHEVISPQGKVNSNQIKRNIRTFFKKKVEQLLP